MHPEIISNNPGNCPKCGMNLVIKNSNHIGLVKYLPLIIIIGMIFLAAVILGFKNYLTLHFFISDIIYYFMTGFFLVFSGFKLIDLRGFARGYADYDLLAKHVFAYGYVYPFIELFFGLVMLFGLVTPWLLWSEFAIMAFSGIGVVIKLLKQEPFQCVCLGTFLKAPLTNITLIEDFGMAGLALAMLLIGFK
mgnify:CR=1 FL=1